MAASTSIQVQLTNRSYTIITGRRILVKSVLNHPLISRSTSRIFVVADVKVKKHIAPLIKSLRNRITKVAYLKGGERSKEIGTLQKLYTSAAHQKLDRNTFILAIGGGVIGDITGFFAATYLRGLKVIHIPTTLMAQVDSSIGGKTGMNLREGKNLVGSFHQPSLVLIDADILKTLPQREFQSGLAEVIKYGVIADRKLFERLEKKMDKVLARDSTELSWIINRCCSIKARVVSKDEFETKGLRAILNFGHTIGHGIEAAAQYKFLHGEAIAIGMIGAAQLSEQFLKFTAKDSQRIANLIKRAGLPTKIPKNISNQKILQAMKLDKKAAEGKIRFVLAQKIGTVKTGIPIPLAMIEKTLQLVKS
jgi:3-dehydroquinate synthase